MKVPRPLFALLGSVLLCMPVAAEQAGVLGYWKEPGGSVIHVERCGKEICASLAALSASAPTRVDAQNPDAALRNRPLCGLRIGAEFHPSSPFQASDGTLYDPKTGKTYHGEMTSSGDELRLRGYVGLPIFGRTQTWTRTSPVETCKT